MKRFVLFAMVVILGMMNVNVSAESADEYWPTWRGPNHAGISAKGNPPLKWSETENIKWKIELTGDASSSSPIIWKNKLFYQTAVETDVKRTPAASNASGSSRGPGGSAPTNVYRFNVVCRDRNTGKLLWEKTVCEVLPHEGHHADHGFASYSPVTDGKSVWTNFGSRGLYCLDMGGNVKWSKDLGQLKTVMSFGEGGSLAVAGDVVVVVRDQQGDSFVYALDKNTGDILWKKERDEPTSWATPLPVEVNGKIQIVTSATNLIRSYALNTGELIWQCSGQVRNVIPSPVAGLGMVYCTSGYRGSSLQAIELGRTGDLSGSDAVRWQVNQATPYVPSPLLYNGKIYVCDLNKEVVSCYDAKTGKAYFVKQTLDGAKGIYSSPAAAANRIYFAGRNGVTCVISSSEKFEILAVNMLDDKFDCSPAFVGSEMYLKGKSNLYCISSSK